MDIIKPFRLTKPRYQAPVIDPSMAYNVPASVYVALSVRRDALDGSVINVSEDVLGETMGAGYINSIRVKPNGDRYASIRVIINGVVYAGSLNWDKTRFCKIHVSHCEKLEIVREA